MTVRLPRQDAEAVRIHPEIPLRFRSHQVFPDGGGACRHHTGGSAAFTRVELITLLGVIALLLFVVRPAMATARGNSDRFVCADHLRRLAAAWQMYADDHGGRLVPNGFGTEQDWVGPLWPDSTDPNAPRLRITQGRLFPYARTLEIYRCPADQTRRYVGSPLNAFVPLLRNYSMNAWMGEQASGWVGSPTTGFQMLTNRALIRQAELTWVFIEEHPEGIGDGGFVVDLVSVGAGARLLDFPAAFHSAGANLAFADGSVRHRAWADARTTPASSGQTLVLNVPSPHNPDVAWLQGLTSYRK